MISACFHKAQVPEKHEFSRFCRFSEQKSRRDFPLLLRKVGRSAAQGKLIHGGMTIMLSRNALGNLINRYAAVLKKCRLLNVFGSLALAAMLAAGSSGAATAFESQFSDHVPEHPDFVAGSVPDLGPPAQVTHTLQKEQTGVVWGVANGADTPALVYADTSNPVAENHGSVWVKASEKGGYAEAMGGQYGTAFTLTNHGYIYVDGTTPSATKGMGVNPDGKAFNEGLIAVRKGSAMADNSGSDAKTIVNNGVISVEETGGVGIYYRKENAARGEVTNNGTILVSNGGTGVVITNNKNDASYNEKHFTSTGTIAADDASTAILVAGTDGATIHLKGDRSRVEGLISLQGTNNRLVIDGMGARGAENLYVKGSFSGSIRNNSNVAFTDNSAVALDGSLAVDATSSAALANVTLTRGSNAPDRALVSVTGDAVTLNGGTATDGTASLTRAVLQKDRVELSGAKAAGHQFSSGAGGVVHADLSNGRSLIIKDSRFSDNLVTENGGAGGAALFVRGNAPVTLQNVEFSNNAVNAGGSRGGAIDNDGAHLSITNGVFAGNRAAASGGALHNAAGGSVVFAGTNVFSGNQAAGAANDVHNAGAVTVASGVTRFDGGYTQKGANASLAVNTGAALAVALPDSGGVTASPKEALLALGKLLNLGGGSLRVGDANARSPASVMFGKNSLLVVDGHAAKSGPMLTGSGSLVVDEGSKLYIANAQAGESYAVTSGLSVADGDYWKSASLLAGRLIEAEISSDGGTITVHTEAQDAARTLPGVIPVRGLNAMMDGGKNDIDSPSAGLRFLSRAMDETYVPDDAAAVAVVNEVSRAAVTAGVQNTALRLADAAVTRTARHLSLSFADAGSAMDESGVTVWAAPLYGNTFSHGLSVSGTSVRGNYGGLVLGADRKVGEVLGGAVRAVLAVNGGGGRSETRGTVSSTGNSYSFGGVNLYAGWNPGNLNVTAGAGWFVGAHDLTLNLPSSMQMGPLRADVDTGAFVADLRGEYRISTSVADITPHAGVRYASLSTDSHTVGSNDATVNAVASDRQDIVQFPVGVTLSKSVDVSGWNVTPLLDVSVIPAAGDKSSTTKVSYAGTHAADSVSTRIMDSMSWEGTVGVQAEKGSFALGLNYGVQASKHESDQSVNVGIRWKF